MGNHYLKWAFTPAAIIAKRDGPFKELATKLTAKQGKRRANAILAHRLGIAVYYILRKKTAFDMKTFCKGKIKMS